MSTRKIIFFIIVWIITISLLIWVFILSNNKPNNKWSGNITIWINNWTTDDFQKIIDWFYQDNSENKKIHITVEKKTSDPEKYRTLLLSTLADWTGPDIFMLPRWEDDLLENRVYPLDSSVVNIAEFERKFELEAFSSLIVDSQDENWKKIQALKWVPIWYETLWVFYNRAILRTGAPSDFSNLELLYSQFPAKIFPTNLGLSKQFVPNISDILPIFLTEEKIYWYDKLKSSYKSFLNYYNYGNLKVATEPDEWNIYNQGSSLRSTESEMKNEKLTTIDKFVRWDIWMIIGYQSLIPEIEKALKRANWNNAQDPALFLTSRLPYFSKNYQNIARYDYFWLSNRSTNPDASLKFLQFLLTENGQRVALEAYPNLIPAQTSFYAGSDSIQLSKTFSRMKLDSFIPKFGDKLLVFEYWMKNIFTDALLNNWSLLQSESLKTTIWNTLYDEIFCSINTTNPECE